MIILKNITSHFELLFFLEYVTPSYSLSVTGKACKALYISHFIPA